jgi:hypothetical protein
MPALTTAATRSAAWLDLRFLTRVDRMLAAVAADRVPATRALALGVTEGELLARLQDRFGPALSLDPAAGPFDLVVAHGELTRAKDPLARLRELDALTAKHLLLVEPRKPFSRQGFTMPGLQRVVSEVMSVREVATPVPVTLLWAVTV